MQMDCLRVLYRPHGHEAPSFTTSTEPTPIAPNRIESNRMLSYKTKGTRTWRAFFRCTRAWRRTNSPTRSMRGSRRCRYGMAWYGMVWCGMQRYRHLRVYGCKARVYGHEAPRTGARCFLFCILSSRATTAVFSRSAASFLLSCVHPSCVRSRCKALYPDTKSPVLNVSILND